MVVGTEALFAAPVMDDKIFYALCVEGDIKKTINAYAKRSGIYISLSDDVLTLLKNLLRADPKQRYTLDEALDHPWVNSDELKLPELL